MTSTKRFLGGCLLAVTLLTPLSACANAIPSSHNAGEVAKAQSKDEFYDALASSEMTNLSKLVENKLNANGNDYEATGNEIREEVKSHDGVKWSYSVNPGNTGYTLKVWTPNGGTFNTEEKAMSLESYSEVPEGGFHDHSHETPEEHAAHSDETLPPAPTGEPTPAG